MVDALGKGGKRNEERGAVGAEEEKVEQGGSRGGAFHVSAWSCSPQRTFESTQLHLTYFPPSYSHNNSQTQKILPQSGSIVTRSHSLEGCNQSPDSGFVLLEFVPRDLGALTPNPFGSPGIDTASGPLTAM